MQTTSNLGLKKPDQNEYVNVEDLNYNVDKMDKLGAPEFDDSGAVPGITSFPDYLTTLVSGTNFFTFFRNLKAGLKFVLHAGQLVNNGQTTEPGFALDARYGKTLADGITQLNANLSTKQDTLNLPSNTPMDYPAENGGPGVALQGGWMMDDTTGYYNLKIGWTLVQFKIANYGELYLRTCWGNNTPSAWKRLVP